jgi:hypothetical protein
MLDMYLAASGTAKMGPPSDPAAVVNHELKVKTAANNQHEL